MSEATQKLWQKVFGKTDDGVRGGLRSTSDEQARLGQTSQPREVDVPELTRKLSRDEMPPLRDVPNDEFLRARNPNEFIGNMTGWLGEHFPLPREMRFKILENKRQLQQLQRTWQNRLQKEHGFSLEDAQRLSPVPVDAAAAVTYLDDIALLPDVMTRIRSSNILERISGAKTIAHEWWHALRQNRNRFIPFEEGSADVFSEIVMHRRLGAKMPLKHSYTGLKEGVDILRQRFGDDWFMASRKASNQKEYLRTTFENAGFDTKKIDKVLENISVENKASRELWGEAVREMLESKYSNSK